MNTFSPTETVNPAEALARDARNRESLYDAELLRILKRDTALNVPPSLQVTAWRNYELQFFTARHRHLAPEAMEYNHTHDAVAIMQRAAALFTDPKQPHGVGFQKKTIPRRALGAIAKAMGYRYERGLVAIKYALAPPQRLQFRQERETFLAKFDRLADAAHAINDKGQNPESAKEVIELFADELRALCPWYELIGQEAVAAGLLKGVDACVKLQAPPALQLKLRRSRAHSGAQ